MQYNIETHRILSYVMKLIRPSTVTSTCKLSSILPIIKENKSDKQDTHDTINNIWEQDAIRSSYYSTMSKQERISLKQRILQRLEDTGKLTILTNTECISIIIEKIELHGGNYQRIATGIYIRDEAGQERIICPLHGGEIILSAGVFESPQILIYSGLYDGKTQLPGKQILQGPYLHELGKNLQDHLLLPYIGIGNWWQDTKRFQSQSLLSTISRKIYDSSPTHSTTMEHILSKYPSNSVHGWIYLDAHGNLYHPNHQYPPK